MFGFQRALAHGREPLQGLPMRTASPSNSQLSFQKAIECSALGTSAVSYSRLARPDQAERTGLWSVDGTANCPPVTCSCRSHPVSQPGLLTGQCKFRRGRQRKQAGERGTYTHEDPQHLRNQPRPPLFPSVSLAKGTALSTGPVAKQWEVVSSWGHERSSSALWACFGLTMALPQAQPKGQHQASNACRPSVIVSYL